MLEDEAPTRIDIITEMEKIPRNNNSSKEEKAARNIQRKQKVAELVSTEVYKKIESDLASYPAWEE